MITQSFIFKMDSSQLNHTYVNSLNMVSKNYAYVMSVTIKRLQMVLYLKKHFEWLLTVHRRKGLWLPLEDVLGAIG